MQKSVDTPPEAKEFCHTVLLMKYYFNNYSVQLFFDVSPIIVVSNFW